ncbi:DegT/DnrJ/EryC1/StrS family aminotransferase [Agromyces mediolanus]|uniref:DegT/DnrJ/EryC1/StrS family aminotransferase n=1 Tax=Agromyces mediolanus TaxID=41986 RepID=UPI0038383878
MTNEQPWYPLATTTWDDAEYAAMREVIEAGRFTMGPRVRRFEEDFARFTGSRYAVMVNSGSSANLLGIAAAAYSPHLGLRRGDEIIVPAVSWATTYYPISQLGFVPVLVDVDPDTLNIDPERVRAAVTPRTRAVFAVNLLGNPAELVALHEICAEHDLLLFEDNCESLGATLRERQTGTFGVFGTYSSFFSHHISTMEGGLVVTDDEYLYQAMLSMRAHGWTRELPAENLIHPKSGDPFDDLFRFVLPGYNLRPLELSGALGIEQLAKLPTLLDGRRENARRFVEALDGFPDARIQRVAADADSSWFGFSFVLTGRLKGRRAELVAALTRAGIESRPIVAGNFARNPVMRHLDARVDGSLHGADEIHSDGLFIGNHHYPIPEQIIAVRELLDTV